MINLFDYWAPRRADPFADYAARFGLSPDQTMRAVGALLPAFALGLRRRAPGPADWMALFQPGAISQADPLAIFFPSRDLADRIADQAAVFTGLNSSILHEMMPALASGLAASLTQKAGDQGWSRPTATAGDTRAAEEGGEALGGMIAAMLGISPGKPEPAPEPVADPIEDSVDALSQMMQTSREAQEEHLRNLQSIFSKMIGGR
jgi:hypothetical protein